MLHYNIILVGRVVLCLHRVYETRFSYGFKCDIQLCNRGWLSLVYRDESHIFAISSQY